MKNTVCVSDRKFDAASIIAEIADSGLKEDAFFICNVREIVEKYDEFVTKTPRVKPYYAVRCNDHWSVLSTLAALGSGFACGSKGEIGTILSLGVDKTRIVYVHPTKAPSHIQFAAENDIDLLVFDNESELYKIKSMFPNARLIMRTKTIANPENSPLKFGCDPFTEAPALLALAKKMGLNVVGTSFHVSSTEKKILERDIAATRQVFDRANEIGFKFNLLSIGGEFPKLVGSTDEMFADIINVSLEKHFPDPHIDIIAELGQSFVSSAFTLACSIQSVALSQTPPEDTQNAHMMYYINDGIYHSFSFATNDPHERKCIPLRIREDAECFNSCIWGQSLDSYDVVVKNQRIPEMNIGDWVYFEDMGAYNLPVTTAFNGFGPVKTLTVCEEKIWKKIMRAVPDTACVQLEEILKSNSNEFMAED